MFRLTAQSKVCIDCKIEKSWGCFYRQSYNKDRLSRRCKECEIIWQNKKKIKESKQLLQSSITIKEKLRSFIGLSFKPIILERDNYCCQLCQATEYLQLHHIVPIKQNNSAENVVNPNNLIILCSDCHLYKAHKGCYNRVDEDIQVVLLKLAESKKYLIRNKILNRVNSL